MLNVSFSPLTIDPEEARKRSIQRVFRVLLDAAARAELSGKVALPAPAPAELVPPAQPLERETGGLGD